MSCEGRRPSAILPGDCDRARDSAGRYSERAIAVLAAIMADDTAAPEIRVTAANAILAWSRTGRSADAAATGKRDSALFPVGVEWFGPPFPNS